MKFLSPRHRIALALTGVVLLIICICRFTELIPDKTKLSVNSRVDLTETIAMGGSTAVINGGISSLDSYLRGIVERNPQLLSSGVRNSDGQLVLEIGKHDDHWALQENEKSNHSQMQVPIFQSATEKWGIIELRFKPIHREGFIGLLQAMDFGLMLTIGSACFVIFSFILKLILKQLDPKNAVPKQVRDALDTLAEGLMILDTNQDILLANDALSKVIGVAPDRLVGKKSSSIKFKTVNDSAKSLPWEIAIEENRMVANTRIQFTDPDNVNRTFLANCSPLLGHQGNYCGVMVTFDDVTQLEESRVQLREAKDAADAANEAKSEFLANMSHEIRTPMNAILGFTDVLRRGIEESPAQRIEYLNTIHSSGNHLIELINDILDLSKVEAGKLEIENREFCLPNLLHETINVLSARASQKQIELSYRIDGLIPASVTSDSTRLRQVLINLIGNAIKFTESGGVKLLCGYDKGNLLLKVIDTGIGMSAEQIERIFDPFSQADSSVTRRFGGTGLGLSISKKFVEALGGTIHAESDFGSGSTFIVEIPVKANNDSLLDEIECMELIRSNATNMVHGENLKLNFARILVVDDAEINRDIVTVVLRRHGIELFEAENGQHAIDVAIANEFDLILMDMQMPVMDGYRATSILREQGIETPIIALTGNAMQGDRQKCLNIGCDEFLPKPIEIDRLVEMLGSFIGFSSENLDTAILEYSPEASLDEPTRATNGGDSLPPAISEGASVEHLSIEPWSSSLPLEDPEFFRIVEKFVDGLPERLQFMIELLQEQDFAELREQGHWLKGVSGTVGLTRLSEPARNLELAARQADEESAIKILSQIVTLADAIDISNPNSAKKKSTAAR